MIIIAVIFTASILVTFLICNFFNFNTSMKKKKTFVILLTILFLFCILNGILTIVSIKNPQISIVEIEEVYSKDIDILMPTYFVKEKENTSLKAIQTNTIYKGDSNYLIKYIYPNMNKVSSFLIGREKVEYKLVVTNPDIIKKIDETN